MKLMIPLSDIMIAPGEHLDVSNYPEEKVTKRIKEVYGVIAEVIDISIEDEMVSIEFRNSTPEKFSEATEALKRGVEEAENGKLLNALKLFKNVLSIVPENLPARRNMAKIYLELGSLDKAKNHLFECLQIDPKDSWSAMMLGNIYARNENNLEVGAFFYDKCMDINPEDAMTACNYAALMMEKGQFQQAEILFKKALESKDIPNAYYGLALLYRMAEHLEPARNVLEKFFSLSPSITGGDNNPVYQQAKELYKEISEGLRLRDKSH